MNSWMKWTLSVGAIMALAACGKEAKPPVAQPAPAAAPTASAPAASAPTPAATLAKDKNGCPAYPKNEWLAEADAKAKIEQMGYKIKSFEPNGNCYEIYGFDKEGKKAEVYFDAKTLAIVKKGD